MSLGCPRVAIERFVRDEYENAVPSPVSVTGLVASGNNLGWTFGGMVPGLGVIAMALLAGILLWSSRRVIR